MYPIAKRTLDLVLSAALLIVLAPLGAAIAAVIKLDSKGPILFRQKVVGLHGREFLLIKFRSMRPGSQDALHRELLNRNISGREPSATDKSGRPIFKTALSDPSRITRVGRILRRLSLDELPQLWNVVVGDMSLVGPRPSLPWEVAMYNRVQRKRITVMPGMTGLYQVTARNRVPVEDMVQIDLEYVRRRSLWLDVVLLVRTPFVMFNGL